MSDTSQQPAMKDTRLGAVMQVGSPDRPEWEDDVALGCECANPALQIERWGQEAPWAGAVS